MRVRMWLASWLASPTAQTSDELAAVTPLNRELGLGGSGVGTFLHELPSQWMAMVPFP